MIWVCKEVIKNFSLDYWFVANQVYIYISEETQVNYVFLGVVMSQRGYDVDWVYFETYAGEVNGEYILNIFGD